MLTEWLVDYCHDVVHGDLVACQKHKWACDRFLRDLSRQGTEDFPYVFAEEKAQRFIDWAMLFKHRKGVLQGKKILPHDIQAFIFCNIYGWVHKDTGYRRFRKAYWQVARKNAKSQSLALISTYEAMAMGESAAEVYCAATKTDQAKIVWKEAEWLLNNCPDLQNKYKIAYSQITHLKSDSIIRALSKEDRKTGDGLNPHCGIVDEYHAHDTSEIYDIIDSGMGARTQPLIVIITTAGYDLNKPCYRVEYGYVSNVLDPNNPVDNDEYFVMINELDEGDNYQDESAWPKANPIICSYEEGLNYLRGQAKISVDVPEKMRTFLTKNMNVWINQKEKGYMDLAKWAKCAGDIPDLKGADCYLGVDLSSKIDLTSISFEFLLEDGKYVVLSHSFMPEDRLFEKMKTDKIPYDLWVREGWITLTSGSVVDYRYVEDYILRQIDTKGWVVQEMCFDPYNATQFAQNMETHGLEQVEIRQGIKTLSEPTKNFREEVYQGNVIHGNNPVLTWAIGNAITRQDHNENIMLDKDKSTNRIDPITSLINAHVRAMVLKDTGSVYDERGVITL